MRSRSQSRSRSRVGKVPRELPPPMPMPMQTTRPSARAPANWETRLGVKLALTGQKRKERIGGKGKGGGGGGGGVDLTLSLTMADEEDDGEYHHEKWVLVDFPDPSAFPPLSSSLPISSSLPLNPFGKPNEPSFHSSARRVLTTEDRKKAQELVDITRITARTLALVRGTIEAFWRVEGVKEFVDELCLSGGRGRGEMEGIV